MSNQRYMLDYPSPGVVSIFLAEKTQLSVQDQLDIARRDFPGLPLDQLLLVPQDNKRILFMMRRP